MEREQGELCSHSATLMMPYHDQGRKKEVFNTPQTSDKPQSDVGDRKKEKKKKKCALELFITGEEDLAFLSRSLFWSYNIHKQHKIPLGIEF